MSKGDRKFAPLFSVWSIDAWAEGWDDWTWNDKFELFEFRTEALDVKRAFLWRLRRYFSDLNSRGIYHGGSDLGRGWYYVSDEWDFLELRRKSDDKPFYAAIREAH